MTVWLILLDDLPPLTGFYLISLMFKFSTMLCAGNIITMTMMILFQVQQEIARPGVLNKFLSDSEAKLVSQLFTGLYTLDMVSLHLGT